MNTRQTRTSKKELETVETVVGVFGESQHIEGVLEQRPKPTVIISQIDLREERQRMDESCSFGSIDALESSLRKLRQENNPSAEEILLSAIFGRLEPCQKQADEVEFDDSLKPWPTICVLLGSPERFTVEDEKKLTDSLTRLTGDFGVRFVRMATGEGEINSLDNLREYLENSLNESHETQEGLDRSSLAEIAHDRTDPDYQFGALDWKVLVSNPLAAGECSARQLLQDGFIRLKRTPLRGWHRF